MGTLEKLCERCGFTDVKTYKASGNVVFDTQDKPATVQAKLEAALLKPMGKPCRVFVRTADELDAVIRANPYPEAHPSRMLIVFLRFTRDARGRVTRFVVWAGRVRHLRFDRRPTGSR